MKQLLANRIQSMAPSATLAMHKKTALLISAGHHIYDLTLGEPDFTTPKAIQLAAKEAIDTEKYFKYPPVSGYLALREAIAHKFNTENQIHCTASQIIVSTGAKQSLSNLFLCLLNPGDEVIVFTPYWVSYVAMIELAGGKPIFFKADEKNNFEYNIAELDTLITPRTKAIIYSSPNNPTGMVLSKDTLKQMATVLEQHKHVLVIADEIYEHIKFIENTFSIGAISAIQDRVITVNGFSKGFAMTGWRVGYMVAPDWLANACEKIQGQLTSGTCSIAQRAALAALKLPKSVIAEMAKSYQQRRDIMLQGLANIPGIQYTVPQGAFYLFPNISHYFGAKGKAFTIHHAEDFCLYMLEKAKVAMVPGTAFGNPNCVRLSFANTMETIEAAMIAIKNALACMQLDSN